MLWPERLSNSMHWGDEARSPGTLGHNPRVDLKTTPRYDREQLMGMGCRSNREEPGSTRKGVVPTSIILHHSISH